MLWGAGQPSGSRRIAEDKMHWHGLAKEHKF